MPTLVSLKNTPFVPSSYCLPAERNLLYIKHVPSCFAHAENALETNSFRAMQEEEENL